MALSYNTNIVYDNNDYGNTTVSIPWVYKSNASVILVKWHGLSTLKTTCLYNKVGQRMRLSNQIL